MDATEIKALRKVLRLSQEQLARDLGVSVTTVSRWEKEHTKPSHLATERLEQLRERVKAATRRGEEEREVYRGRGNG